MILDEECSVIFSNVLVLVFVWHALSKLGMAVLVLLREIKEDIRNSCA